MKYHRGQCEICDFSAPKPLDHVTFVCKADTGRTRGDSDIVSKNNKTKRKCRYFAFESLTLRELAQLYDTTIKEAPGATYDAEYKKATEPILNQRWVRLKDLRVMGIAKKSNV